MAHAVAVAHRIKAMAHAVAVAHRTKTVAHAHAVTHAHAARHRGHRNVDGNGHIDDPRLVAMHATVHFGVHFHFGLFDPLENFFWMHVQIRREGEFRRRKLLKHKRLGINVARLLEVQREINESAVFRFLIHVEHHQMRTIRGHDGAFAARDAQFIQFVHLDNAILILVTRQVNLDLDAVRRAHSKQHILLRAQILHNHQAHADAGLAGRNGDRKPDVNSGIHFFIGKHRVGTNSNRESRRCGAGNCPHTHFLDSHYSSPL